MQRRSFVLATAACCAVGGAARAQHVATHHGGSVQSAVHEAFTSG